MPQLEIAIAPFLASCPGVITLGVRAAVAHYSPAERKLLASARRIFFPTPRFAKIFEAAGKEVFPSAFTYSLRKSRVVQETFFQLCETAFADLRSPLFHPRARIYFGRQKETIASDFAFPFLTMGPAAADGARVIANETELAEQARRHNPLIARELCRFGERVLLVFVNYQCIAAIRPDQREGPTRFSDPDFFAPLGLDAFTARLARVLRSFRINDIAVEAGFDEAAGWRAAAMARPPVNWRSHGGTINRHRHISSLIEKMEIS